MSIRAMFVGNAPARAVASAKKPAAAPTDHPEPAPTRDVVHDLPLVPAPPEKPEPPAASAGPRE